MKLRRNTVKNKTISEKIGYYVGQILAIAIVVGITIALFYLVYWLIINFSKILAAIITYSVNFLNIFTTLNAVIIVAIIGAVATFSVNIIAKISDHKWERQQYLTEKRESAYEDFLALFFNSLQGNAVNNEEGIERLNRFKQTLMLYGSKRTYKAFKRWWKAITGGESSVERQLELMELIISEMRNDVKAGKITKGLLVSVMTKSSE